MKSKSLVAVAVALLVIAAAVVLTWYLTKKSKNNLNTEYVPGNQSSDSENAAAFYMQKRKAPVKVAKGGAAVAREGAMAGKGAALANVVNRVGGFSAASGAPVSGKLGEMQKALTEQRGAKYESLQQSERTRQVKGFEAGNLRDLFMDKPEREPEDLHFGNNPVVH